jgi:hypothetical protein
MTNATTLRELMTDALLHRNDAAYWTGLYNHNNDDGIDDRRSSGHGQ